MSTVTTVMAAPSLIVDKQAEHYRRQVKLPRFTPFLRDQRGSTAMVFGLMIAPIMMMLGMAVDYSRMLAARNQTQTALDASALAAARAMQLNLSNGPAAAAAAAQSYYDAIKPAAVVSSSLTITPITAGSTTFTVTATNWVKTPFLSIGDRFTTRAIDPGAPTGCLQSPTQCMKIVNTSTTSLAQGGNASQSIEVSMMIDITGSMNESAGSGKTKIQVVRQAAAQAVDILIWADQSKYTSKVGVVPFAYDVRLPTAKAFNAATGGLPGNVGAYGQTYYPVSNQYCVIERQGTEMYTDAAPGPGAYSKVQRVSYQNASCNVPTSATLMPLTSDKTSLKNMINNLPTAGSTAGHIGTAWAWYMLSPNFNTLWETTNQASAYNTPKMQKYAILMTDGDYNTQYDSNGISVGNAGANDYSTTQAAALCTNMKAKGITVFTIGAQVSASAKTFLQGCSTQNNPGSGVYEHYYDATDGNALTAAFNNIALLIASIKITN